jgi:hypothetical protein
MARKRNPRYFAWRRKWCNDVRRAVDGPPVTPTESLQAMESDRSKHAHEKLAARLNQLRERMRPEHW